MRILSYRVRSFPTWSPRAKAEAKQWKQQFSTESSQKRVYQRMVLEKQSNEWKKGFDKGHASAQTECEAKIHGARANNHTHTRTNTLANTYLTLLVPAHTHTHTRPTPSTRG